ncbi:RNA polymerase sigma factor [uncultured Limosilactobacillus sp.]|uniref:RNA polymerase sigma factor n=1 Tax=uncultured Limosilactobacillus sp. TaxID=2837629 RepID=UPI0025F0B8C5|nr:sigma-70 family RNA polymerase sigma factor [uncultured Limosilactobacillus sp.]
MSPKLIQTTPESELIKQVAGKDSASFAVLYNQYLPLICKLWYQFRLDEVPLDDWKQEAAVVLYRTACSYSCNEARFCWYLRQALTNKIRDLYRQQVAKKRVPAHQIESITDVQIDQRLVDINLQPDEVSHFRSIYQQFLKECSRLEKDAFLGINSGERLESIAQQLRCSPLAIRAAFERARKKLKQRLLS